MASPSAVCSAEFPVVPVIEFGLGAFAGLGGLLESNGTDLFVSSHQQPKTTPYPVEQLSGCFLVGTKVKSDR